MDQPAASREPLLLVVDDTADARDFWAAYLEIRGYRVVIAADGLDALAQAVETRPDLIVMDLSMPRLDGWEATRRLKSDPRTAAIPVIAFTAHDAGSLHDEARAAGCATVVTKPVNPRDLDDQIRALLAQG